MRPSSRYYVDSEDSFEGWQTGLAVFGVGVYLVHIAAMGGGAWVLHHWLDGSNPPCLWAPGAFLVGAGTLMVILPFLAALVSRYTENVASDKAALLAWIVLSLIVVFGCFTLFLWGPKDCANPALWSIVFALVVTDALLWISLCIAPIFTRRGMSGYRVLIVGEGPVYEHIPIAI